MKISRENSLTATATELLLYLTTLTHELLEFSYIFIFSGLFVARTRHNGTRNGQISVMKYRKEDKLTALSLY